METYISINTHIFDFIIKRNTMMMYLLSFDIINDGILVFRRY